VVQSIGGIFYVTAKAVTYKDRVPAKVKRAGPAKSIGDAGSAQGALCSSGQAGATRDKAKAPAPRNSGGTQTARRRPAVRKAKARSKEQSVAIVLVPA